jgi:hypothetical protein
MFRSPIRSAVAMSGLAYATCAFATAEPGRAAFGVSGRLTCTADVTYGDASRPLSCNFQLTDGNTARFAGSIEQKGGTGDDRQPHAKRVFVWVVHGPPGIVAKDLTGIFVRRNPPQAPLQPGFENALISSNGAIALLPVSGKEQVSGDPTVTVLQLNLKAVSV